MAKGAVTFDSAMVYGVIIKRVHGVVKKAGRIAVGSARERAPVRKIFKGGRRSKPRFYGLAEAKAELPAFLRTEPRHQSGRLMSQSQALGYLQKVPIATGRNKANSWQRTGTVPQSTAKYRRRALDDLANPRKDEKGNDVFAAMRSIEVGRSTGNAHRLYDRGAESQLTPRGRWELKNAAKRKSISFGQTAKADAQAHSKFNSEGQKMESNTPGPGDQGELGGNLRRSIELRDIGTGDEPRVSIVAGGDDAPYARFVEFGTRHAAAQPFLRPALKHVEGPYKALMREAFPGSR